jgi:hypothetical protein
MREEIRKCVLVKTLTVNAPTEAGGGLESLLLVEILNA